MRVFLMRSLVCKTILLVVYLLIGTNSPVLGQKMRMGTTTALWKDLSLNDFLSAKAEGIEYVEVALNQCYRNIPDNEVFPCINALKQKLDAAGLKVWSIHLPFSKSLDISILDNELRKENMQTLIKMIEISEIFNPSKLVLHASSEPISDSIRNQRINNAIESIDVLRVYAKKIDAQLCIENLPRTCLGNTPEELLYIISDFPDVGICFDTNHYLKGTPLYFAQLAGDRIATVHISDYDGLDEKHWIPGDGTINWIELIAVLQSKGYNGVYMYEALRGADGRRLQSKDLVESFDYIKQNL